MKTSHKLTIAALISAFFVGVWTALPAAAQQSDVEAVKTASKNFYAALAAIDFETMAKVWAHTPYVTYVGRAPKRSQSAGRPKRNYGRTVINFSQ